LEKTRQHVSRLERIFQQIGEKSSGETCEAMKGLIKEGEILVKAEGEPDVRDAGLIGAAQRVEHYEIADHQDSYIRERFRWKERNTPRFRSWMATFPIIRWGMQHDQWKTNNESRSFSESSAFCPDTVTV
jgi:hypothetical protein